MDWCHFCLKKKPQKEAKVSEPLPRVFKRSELECEAEMIDAVVVCLLCLFQGRQRARRRADGDLQGAAAAGVSLRQRPEVPGCVQHARSSAKTTSCC